MDEVWKTESIRRRQAPARGQSRGRASDSEQHIGIGVLKEQRLVRRNDTARPDGGPDWLRTIRDESDEVPRSDLGGKLRHLLR